MAIRGKCRTRDFRGAVDLESTEIILVGASQILPKPERPARMFAADLVILRTKYLPGPASGVSLMANLRPLSVYEGYRNGDKEARALHIQG